jgi:hypothetical protein
VSHRNLDYDAEGKKLGIEGKDAYDLDHSAGWRAGSSNLEVALREWSSGFPLPGWKERFPDAQQPSGAFSAVLQGRAEFENQLQFDEEDFKGEKFDEVRLDSSITTRQDALFQANSLAYAMPGETRKIDVTRDINNQWSYFYTTPSYAGPTTPQAAMDIVNDLNTRKISTFGEDDEPEYRWVVGNLNTANGIYYINREKVPADIDEPDKFDPDQPLMLQTEGPNKGKPVVMDLQDGSRVYVTTDGRFVHSGPVDEGDVPSWLTDDFDATKIKLITVGKGDKATDWMVWPDGSRTEVGDKYTGGINPKDLEIMGGEQLKDGTWVQFLNNGQILRTGRERVDATTTWDNDLQKYRVTQPDGSIGFEEPADPTYDPGLVTLPSDVGDYHFFEQRTGQFDKAGLPEVPATIETMEGPDGVDLGYGIRGTQGELLPLNDLLDRAIEAAVVNGDMDKAVAFDDFRKRPSRTEALKMALEFARSPADQVLISAISAGETYIAPPPAGTLQRVGPQADFLVEAYEEFRAALTGGRMPTTGEFQQAMAPQPEPVSELDQLKIAGQTLDNQIKAATLENLQTKGVDDHANSEARTDNSKANTESTVTKTGIAVDNQASKISAVVGGDSSSDDDDSPVAAFERGPGNDPRLSDKMNEWFASKGMDTSGFSAGTLTHHLQADASGSRSDPDLGMLITENKFDPAVTERQEQHVSEFRAAVDWAASQGLDQSDFHGVGQYMMDAHQEFLVEEARADLAEAHDVQVGALTDILLGSDYAANVEKYGQVVVDKYGPRGTYAAETGETGVLSDWIGTTGMGIGRMEWLGETGNVPLVGTAGAATLGDVTEGGGAETLGSLTDYPAGVTFDDLQAAVWLQSEQADIETAKQTAIAETPGSVQSASGEHFVDFAALEASLGVESLAGGGRVGGEEMALVGESGPEVALFPNGTEIIPLDRNVKPAQARRLRQRGIRGMANGGEIGGVVFPVTDDISQVEDVDLSRYGGVLPSGVRRTIAGQGIRPSRGYLSRAAGIGLPSGQALRNMLPEELDVLKDIGAQTGIPERAFERELALGIPSGERQRGSARFLPLSLRS